MINNKQPSACRSINWQRLIIEPFDKTKITQHTITNGNNKIENRWKLFSICVTRIKDVMNKLDLFFKLYRELPIWIFFFLFNERLYIVLKQLRTAVGLNQTTLINSLYFLSFFSIVGLIHSLSPSAALLTHKILVWRVSKSAALIAP